MSCESSLRSCSRNKVGGHDVALGIAAPGHGGIFSWLNALANSKRHLPVPRLERSDSVAALVTIRRILRTYRTYQPCVFVVTAYGDEEHRSADSEAGAKGFLEKPVNKYALLAEIHRVLEAEECGLPASEGEGP